MAPTTEFEDTSGASWTSLSNEATFLSTIAAETDATLGEPGESVEGRSIWRLDIGTPTDGTWLIAAAQHADERVSREAALIFARDLAYSVDMAITDYLASHRVVVMPTTNPDGIANDTRHNADGIDINRDHLAFHTPEAQVMHQVVRAVSPHLVLDAHERLQDFGNDIEYRPPELAALHPALRSLGNDLVPHLAAAFDAESIDHALYEPPGRVSFREMSSLHGSVGFLLETMTFDAPLDRAEYYAVALEAMREWHGDHAEELSEARSSALGSQPGEEFPLQTGTTAQGGNWPIIQLPAGITGYELTDPIPQRIITAYDLTASSGQVSLSQSRWQVVPYLVDEESTDRVIDAGVRLFGTDSDPDDPGLPQVATATIRTRLTWLSCNLSDGAVITELPDLQGDEVSRVIGEYTSANLGLPIPAVGGRDLSLSQRAHLAAISTEPARTMIVPVVNDVPTAGFIPLTRDLGTEATVALGCVSLEGYLRHRYVRDHLWEGVDPAEIARGVLADAEDIDGNGQGLNLIVDAPDVGLNAGRYFEAIDDETVYGALSELMDAGLIEWTIDVDWRDGFAYRIVDKIARVRLRLGLSGDPQAVFQSATFSSQGASDARYTLKGEYSGDRYGNYIVARGTGEGEDKPRSSAQIDQGALDGGAPIWEQRIQPDIYRSPLFTESQFNTYVQEQLLLHAQQELARIRRGGQTLEITARWDAPGARYGVDWSIGDDVLHELRGHAHPEGLHGVRRAIGFALSIQRGTIRPILQEEDA